MGKNKGHGKSAILTQSDFEKIYSNLKLDSHKLIVNLMRYTGERVGAVIQLRVSDVYVNPWRSQPLPEITYRRITRKQSAGQLAATRQVPVSRSLKFCLEQFIPPGGELLFPSPIKPNQPISYQAVDKFLRAACKSAGLGRVGISCHSFRRSFITKLATEGVPVPVIKKITGHVSTDTLIKHYVEVDNKQIERALELI